MIWVWNMPSLQPSRYKIHQSCDFLRIMKQMQPTRDRIYRISLHQLCGKSSKLHKTSAPIQCQESKIVQWWWGPCNWYGVNDECVLPIHICVHNVLSGIESQAILNSEEINYWKSWITNLSGIMFLVMRYFFD